MDEQGNITYEIVKNEDYLGKIIQTTCKTIINFNPVSQAIEISGNKINMNEEDFNNMKVYPLYSLGLIIIITAIGIYLFNIKELKQEEKCDLALFNKFFVNDYNSFYDNKNIFDEKID